MLRTSVRLRDVVWDLFYVQQLIITMSGARRILKQGVELEFGNRYR